jgi:serine protease Do
LWNHLKWLRTKSLAGCSLAIVAQIILTAGACGKVAFEPTVTPDSFPVMTVEAPITTVVDQPPINDTQPSKSLVVLATLPSIADVVESSSPWVVSITTESFVTVYRRDYKHQESGSGIIVRSDGYIVTNYHVIQSSTDIKVHLPSGDTYPASLVGVDDVTDLAVLKIDAIDLPSATFGVSDDLRVGDWVVTIGNALALKGGPTVTLGIVSGLDRTISADEGRRQFYDLIQTDAAINTGNSGGPLVNMAGDVVGVNQARLPQAQGVGFAIGSDVVVPVIQGLMKTGRISRPMIGFIGQDVTSATADALNLDVSEGVIVTVILKSGPAYQSGVRVGDVLTKIDGIPVVDVEEWLKLLWSYDVGSKVDIELFRNGEIINTTVQLGERES